MSHLFSGQSLAKAYGAQILFSDVSLVISTGDRIGLIGPNGSGKSTLLKIICGLEEADSGTIVRQKHICASYLAQEDRFAEQLSAMENLLQALAAMPLGEAEKLSRAQTILSRAEFLEPGCPVTRLSGGWRKRLSICRALITEPDLLVLDEPTNHLDIEGIIWLERLLAGNFAGSPAAFILVSHDRRFLENSVNRVVELARVYPAGSFQVDGTYSSFLEKRQLFLEQQHDQEARLANKVRRETEWLRRGPKARATKARYRIDEAHRLQDELGQVKERNRSEGSVAIDFAATGRKTKKLLEAENLSKRYGERQLFAGLDIRLSPGTRLGLLGRNGCGKTSLMQMLAAAGSSQLPPGEGTISVADGLKIVNFSQDRAGLDQQSTLRRALAPDGDGVIFQGRLIHVVSWAKRFLFRPDQLETPVAQLSGGEQARILIADLMRQPADILLLDEPTNDLDISSLDVLEESLLEFGGALVLVTHDRYLLDRVCSLVLGFLGDGSVRYYADYQQWLRELETQSAAREQPEKKAAPAAPPPKAKSSGRLSYLDQREYDRMEEMIMAAEEELGRLERQMAQPAVSADPARLQEVWEQLEQAKEQVEGLYRRWDELEAKKIEGF